MGLGMFADHSFHDMLTKYSTQVLVNGDSVSPLIHDMKAHSLMLQISVSDVMYTPEYDDVDNLSGSGYVARSNTCFTLGC